MAYTRATTWASGQVLTHTDLNAEFDAVQADLNAKDGADLNNGSVTTSKLASPNGYYILTVPCIREADSRGTGAVGTAEAGLGDGLTAVDFPFRVAVASVLTAVTACCEDAASAGGTRDNQAQVRQNGSNLAATITAFPDTGGSNHTSGLSISLAPTDTLLIRCQTDSAATDGVTGGYVELHLVAVHQV